jgi:hypothetical protein
VRLKKIPGLPDGFIVIVTGVPEWMPIPDIFIGFDTVFMIRLFD